MKKVCIIFTLLIILLFSACGSSSTEHFEEGYRSGYDEGYAQGYQDGIAAAKREIPDIAADELNELCMEIEREWGIDPEDAAKLLANYADVPDEVNDEDIPNAIWAIYSFYRSVWDVIDGMSQYSLG